MAERRGAVAEIGAAIGIDFAFERIARDSTTLGNLITRHLGEFDRTVKTYGGEMVERLGERTQEVVTAMRDDLDNFDTRVNAKATEITSSLDQQFIGFHDALDGRAQTINDQLTAHVSAIGGKVSEVTTTVDEQFSRFQNALDGRTQTLNEALSSRVMDIAKTMSDGGKEVVSALDQRISVMKKWAGRLQAHRAALIEADSVDTGYGQISRIAPDMVIGSVLRLCAVAPAIFERSHRAGNSPGAPNVAYRT